VNRCASANRQRQDRPKPLEAKFASNLQRQNQEQRQRTGVSALHGRGACPAVELPHSSQKRLEGATCPKFYRGREHAAPTPSQRTRRSGAPAIWFTGAALPQPAGSRGWFCAGLRQLVPFPNPFQFEIKIRPAPRAKFCRGREHAGPTHSQKTRM